MAAVQGYGQDGLRESWDERQGGQPFRGASKDIIVAAFLDAGCMASRRRAGPEPVQEDFLHEGRSASCGSGTNGGLEHVWSPRGGGPFSHALVPPCMDPLMAAVERGQRTPDPDRKSYVSCGSGQERVENPGTARNSV